MEHVLPNSGGLFGLGLLEVFFATIVKGIGYFEFAALDYASRDKVVEFFHAGWDHKVEKGVEAARFEPDPQGEERGV